MGYNKGMRKRSVVSSGRSPFFRKVRQWLQLASLPETEYERVQEYLSRREFLKRAAALTATAFVTPYLTATAQARPRSTARIVIVGAGMAGLSAMYHLHREGYSATLYEASQRAGGRIYSAQGIFAPELTTELGGEFIDSIHDDMLEFARLFELELIDTMAPTETGLETRYFFDGQGYTEAQIIEALRSIAQQIKYDAQRAGYPVTYDRYNEYAYQLDHTALSDYLTRVGATGWLYKLLEVAYVTEYGREAHEQSALNLIFLIDTRLNDGFEIFGESDERYKIRGGNQQIPNRLAQMFADQIYYGHRLVAIHSHQGGYRLTFEREGGSMLDVDADFVLLTLPFTILRQVDIRVPLPPVKRRAIQELGYGTNAKLILGFHTRYWRTAGYSGDFFCDEWFQSGWDSSRQQAGSAGSLTLFLGGRAGIEVGRGSATAQARVALPGVERVFPGASSEYTGQAVRFHWPSYPYTLCSYACWTVGQYTSIAGAEFEPVGNLYFAGEHCSIDYQGYMNGAAETGRRAARNIVRALR
ncbi:monoamine oxidase [Armatimonadetes bacterium GBS]|jgi:monoamine oxidase|nr:Putative flavin-containing monoamine oxidase AofH [bacterium HR14]GIV13108.1 MAG: hypothetical protein KatS3mg021_1390 [Fimbriimonadales bacterium]CUU03993.1 monoamine oxidase [Armatimonadetes bacterium GBS]CUU38374.1 monoamine oxidase [Armatimonadetes bacterium GXS]